MFETNENVIIWVYGYPNLGDTALILKLSIGTKDNPTAYVSKKEVVTWKPADAGGEEGAEEEISGEDAEEEEGDDEDPVSPVSDGFGDSY
jgi:hypothetical protein